MRQGGSIWAWPCSDTQPGGEILTDVFLLVSGVPWDATCWLCTSPDFVLGLLATAACFKSYAQLAKWWTGLVLSFKEEQHFWCLCHATGMTRRTNSKQSIQLPQRPYSTSLGRKQPDPLWVGSWRQWEGRTPFKQEEITGKTRLRED